MTISVKIEHTGGSKKLEIVGGTHEGGAFQQAVLEQGQSTLLTVYDWKTFSIRELDESTQAVPDGCSNPLVDDVPPEIPADTGSEAATDTGSEAATDAESSGQAAEVISDNEDGASARETAEDLREQAGDEADPSNTAGPPRV